MQITDSISRQTFIYLTIPSFHLVVIVKYMKQPNK